MFFIIRESLSMKQCDFFSVGEVQKVHLFHKINCEIVITFFSRWGDSNNFFLGGGSTKSTKKYKSFYDLKKLLIQKNVIFCCVSNFFREHVLVRAHATLPGEKT